MSLYQLDTENADRDITTLITVLTHTPTVNGMCVGLVKLGDGAKDLDGTGGDFQLVITVGGQTVQPSPQTITFSTAVRGMVWTTPFPVVANDEVIMRVLSPNAADSDVDCAAYLYDSVFALPGAAADAAGGLPISDAGNLDLDTKLANTNEITVARMGALTDWINGGRLDLILDDILLDTATTIPGLIAALENLSQAQAEAACDAALATYDSPTRAEATSDKDEIIVEVDANETKIDTMQGNVTDILADTNELQLDWTNGGRLDLILDDILLDTATTIPGLIAALNNISAADILTTALTESYAADGATFTLSQAFYMIWSLLAELEDVDTTTPDSKTLAGAVAMSFLTDNAANPTNITRTA